MGRSVQRVLTGCWGRDVGDGWPVLKGCISTLMSGHQEWLILDSWLGHPGWEAGLGRWVVSTAGDGHLVSQC